MFLCVASHGAVGSTCDHCSVCTRFESAGTPTALADVFFFFFLQSLQANDEVLSLRHSVIPVHIFEFITYLPHDMTACGLTHK